MPDEILAAGLFLRRPVSGGWRWLLLHGSRHREWGFPKGHAEPGESLLQAALRECAEECGIGLLRVEGPPAILRYRLPDGRAKAVAYYPALTRQERIRLSSEHDRHVWLDAPAALERIAHQTLRDCFATTLP